MTDDDARLLQMLIEDGSLIRVPMALTDALGVQVACFRSCHAPLAPSDDWDLRLWVTPTGFTVMEHGSERDLELVNTPSFYDAELALRTEALKIQEHREKADE